MREVYLRYRITVTNIMTGFSREWFVTEDKKEADAALAWGELLYSTYMFDMTEEEFS